MSRRCPCVFIYIIYIYICVCVCFHSQLCLSPHRSQTVQLVETIVDPSGVRLHARSSYASSLNMTVDWHLCVVWSSRVRSYCGRRVPTLSPWLWPSTPSGKIRTFKLVKSQDPLKFQNPSKKRYACGLIASLFLFPVPLCCCCSGVRGLIVSLDENGLLSLGYLGTDPPTSAVAAVPDSPLKVRNKRHVIYIPCDSLRMIYCIPIYPTWKWWIKSIDLSWHWGDLGVQSFSKYK